MLGKKTERLLQMTTMIPSSPLYVKTSESVSVPMLPKKCFDNDASKWYGFDTRVSLTSSFQKPADCLGSNSIQTVQNQRFPRTPKLLRYQDFQTTRSSCHGFTKCLSVLLQLAPSTQHSSLFHVKGFHESFDGRTRTPPETVENPSLGERTCRKRVSAMIDHQTVCPHPNAFPT